MTPVGRAAVVKKKILKDGILLSSERGRGKSERGRMFIID